MFEPATQPAARDQLGKAHQIEAAIGPAVLHANCELRRRFLLVEAAIGEATDLRLHAGDKTAAETLRAVEFARTTQHDNAGSIKGAGHILAGARRHGLTLPINRSSVRHDMKRRPVRLAHPRSPVGIGNIVPSSVLFQAGTLGRGTWSISAHFPCRCGLSCLPSRIRRMPEM